MLLKTIFIFYFLKTVISEDSINCTTCIKVNETCHNLTKLFDLQGNFRNQIVIPQIVVHQKKNTLYYSFEPRIGDPEYYKVGFVNLNNSKVNGVLEPKPDSKQLFNFGTMAIDEENGIIYLGGSDGIFQLDTNTYSVVQYSSRGDTITSLAYRNNIFFTVYPENKIRIKKGDRFEEVKGFENEYVKNFAIDPSGVTYFMGIKGLFAKKNGDNETLVLSDNAFFRGMAMDKHGELYTWWLDGVYKVFKHNDWRKSVLERVAHLPSIGAMTFDKDNNFLLTFGKSLFKLEPTDAIHCKNIEDDQ